MCLWMCELWRRMVKTLYVNKICSCTRNSRQIMWKWLCPYDDFRWSLITNAIGCTQFVSISSCLLFSSYMIFPILRLCVFFFRVHKILLLTHGVGVSWFKLSRLCLFVTQNVWVSEHEVDELTNDVNRVHHKTKCLLFTFFSRSYSLCVECANVCEREIEKKRECLCIFFTRFNHMAHMREHLQCWLYCRTSFYWCKRDESAVQFNS